MSEQEAAAAAPAQAPAPSAQSAFNALQYLKESRPFFSAVRHEMGHAALDHISVFLHQLLGKEQGVAPVAAPEASQPVEGVVS